MAFLREDVELLIFYFVSALEKPLEGFEGFKYVFN